MKVMQMIHGFNTGGAETIVKQYAINLDKKLFDVVVLCFERHEESPYDQELKDNGIRVIYICDSMKFYKKRNIFCKIINHLQIYYYVRKYIHIEKPDIIHTHLPLSTYIKFSKPKKRTMLYHTVHAEPTNFWPRKKADFKAVRWLVKKYNMRFITLHDEMRKEINEMFNVNNTLVLNNGIDFTKFNNPLPKKEIRKKLEIDNDAFVIGHVGRFNKVKNHQFLIDVFHEIYKKNDKAFLLLVGDGEEKNNIINKLKNLGLEDRYLVLSNRSDIADLLNAMDVFIFPSISEGLGISLIEAQKMKLPCFISTNIPEAAIISNLVTKISLSEKSQVWRDTIINYKIPSKIILNDNDWNIKQVVKKLENIYLDK